MTSDSTKRDALLRRAVEIFGSRGYRATSMREIAEHVNMSKSALYHYFSSKEELLVAIYQSVIAENVEAARRVTESSAPPVEALRHMLVDRVAYTCRNRRILAIFHEEEAELPPRLMKEVVASRRAYQAQVTELLDRGREAGDFEFSTTSTIVANALLGSCNWAYKWYQPRGPLSPEDLANDVVNVLLSGVLAPRARSAAH
jgi:AcrR family transcriptional regulator